MSQQFGPDFLLCFRPLFAGGVSYFFPCDDAGRVDLDGLAEDDRNDYLFARAMVGRELEVPAVERSGSARIPRVPREVLR